MKTKTEKKQKLLKLFAVFIVFTLNTQVFAQTSSALTQSVCVNSTEPYVLPSAPATSSFNWFLSGGGVITFGQGSSSITIDWGAVSSGGPHTLSVVETDANGCLGPQKSVEVTLVEFDNSSFTLTDYCAGSSNSASAIAAPGGSFIFNPLPSGSETINALTGEISAGAGGTSYGVEYITSGICPSNLIQNVLIYSTPSTGPIFHN